MKKKIPRIHSDGSPSFGSQFKKVSMSRKVTHLTISDAVREVERSFGSFIFPSSHLLIRKTHVPLNNQTVQTNESHFLASLIELFQPTAYISFRRSKIVSCLPLSIYCLIHLHYVTPSVPKRKYLPPLFFLRSTSG